ncbi:MAG: Hsp70 family protein [Deltaproteobacteria bacterium]|nr:Hsp70 family protein [Deltaproteobacteria bacterium]
MGHIVGIDLGTTNSLVAHLVNDRPEIIPNRLGRRLTPSIVGLDDAGRIVVGEPARARLSTHPDRTVAEVKRLLGTTAKVNLGGRDYSTTELSAFILKQLKEDAEAFFGAPVPEAVITVPAYFTDAQRQATKDAGEIVGFKVERIINEPTAAALAYGLDHIADEKMVLVYDLGGGTFDVSVLEMFQGVLDVKSSSGNTRLGGSDFDRAIVDWACERIEREQQVSPRADAGAMARLKRAAELAKIDLSSAPTTRLTLPDLLLRAGQSLSIDLELTRERFEALVGPLVHSTLGPVESALRDARLKPQDISEVVIVGGSSRVPLVRRVVEEHFGRALPTGIDPDEAIALGAAVQAGLKSGAVSSEKGILISDVCPFTLGVEVSTRAGSALQGGHFSPIIPRNSTVPVSRSEIYSTVGHSQTEVTVRVFQGEARLTRDNVFLDEYTVGGIPPAPAGAEKIAIGFAYDINGILAVTTRVLSTGKEAALRVEKNALRLSPAERQAAEAKVEQAWPAQAPADGAAPSTSANDADQARDELLEAAARRSSAAAPQVRERIEALCRQLREAPLGSALAAEADRALVDALLELE